MSRDFGSLSVPKEGPLSKRSKAGARSLSDAIGNFDHQEQNVTFVKQKIHPIFLHFASEPHYGLALKF